MKKNEGHSWVLFTTLIVGMLVMAGVMILGILASVGNYEAEGVIHGGHALSQPSKEMLAKSERLEKGKWNLLLCIITVLIVNTGGQRLIPWLLMRYHRPKNVVVIRPR